VLGLAVDFSGAGLFDDLALGHDEDFIADVLDYGEVMCDE
jgi:hypothetical protein